MSSILKFNLSLLVIIFFSISVNAAENKKIYDGLQKQDSNLNKSYESEAGYQGVYRENHATSIALNAGQLVKKQKNKKSSSK